MNRATLDELGLRHGTDKASDRHNYLRHYAELLSPWRDDPISVLEIGVFNGASLATWRDYFLRGTIIGLDIDPTAVQYDDGSRVHVRIGSQADPEFLAAVAAEYGPFQAILDDGSHNGDDQKISFEALYPSLLPGGLYIVEDLHTSYFGWGNFMKYARERLDELVWPGGAAFSHGHGDPRNHPEWLRIQAGMSDFARQTKSMEFRSSLIIFRKWLQTERF
jgi:hypothetical protein